MAATKGAEVHAHADGDAHAHGEGHGHSHGADDAHAHSHGHGHGHSHGPGASDDDCGGSKAAVKVKGSDAYAVDAAQADAWCTDAWRGECKALDAAVGRVVTGFVADPTHGRQALLYFAPDSGSGSGSGSSTGSGSSDKPYRLVPLSALVPAPAPSTLVQLEQSPLFYAAANGQSKAVSALMSHHASGNTGFGTTTGKHVVYSAKAVAGGFEVDFHPPSAPVPGTDNASGENGAKATPRANSRLVSASDIARANGFADVGATLDRHQQCRMCSGGGDCTLM